MRSKVLNDADERTFALIFETGEEPMSLLTRFAEDHEITAARFTAIGAFSDATIAYFDWDAKDYRRIPIDEQVEVLSLIGDVALDGATPKVHAHVVLGTREGHARGGHLMEAHVRPTLEVMLEESPRHLKRVYDAAAGLALIRIEE
ncbi:MAG: PPC domain-containing DNA-binding protein [Rhodospirillaceae bacterium]